MIKKSIAWAVLSAVVTVTAGSSLSLKAEAGTYNYGEALQKAIMFYEFQRSGKLPTDKRDNWRGDSGLDDGKLEGLDLTGGWYDAGDHIKFNLPGAYSSTMLAWSVYEDRENYEKNGQLKYIMDAIKWENDYLMKCHPEPNVYYYQVGTKNADHDWWGPAEVMQMERKARKATMSQPATTAVAEAAASLGAAAAIFKDTDPDYAAKCLKHAKELFSFADTTKSDSGYDSEGCYAVESGKFYDELSWAATWIYLADTNANRSYLNKAEGYVDRWCNGYIPYNWCQDWVNVYNGTELLLAKITNKSRYKEAIEQHLDFWSGQIRNVNGLATLNGYGSLRYAAAASFLAGVYADWSGANRTKAATYRKFLAQQINYILGDNPNRISYEVGFGNNYPQYPHHRTAHGSWNNDNVNPTPKKERHILYGALVGGPDENGTYRDQLLEYTLNEVACDYNAGFVGALSKMHKLYGGDPIPNFKAIEEKEDEFFVETNISGGGSNTTVKAVINNISGWPARLSDKLTFRYFVTLEPGVSPSQVRISTTYKEAGNMSSSLKAFDASKNIYYIEGDFTGTLIGPGSSNSYKKEIQFTISGPSGWNNSNDFSYTTSSGKNKKIAVYDNGVLVGGEDPAGNKPVDNVSGGSGTGGGGTETPAVKGDVNGDKAVDLRDYVALQQYLANNSSPINKGAADLNGDNNITISDLIALRDILLV